MRKADGTVETIESDWVVSAVPVERFQQLLTPEVLTADPSLARVSSLRTDWMNGLMFYLTKEVPVTPGHVNYVESPWAITSISEAQFWRRDFSTYGDGTVKDCLSSIISDWSAPGRFNGKRAKDCTPEEIAEEAWEQIKWHLNDTGVTVVSDAILHSWHLDPGIIASGTPDVVNDEPLFIQTPGSWTQRPDSKTALENLFLAGDWVKTNINVTTMEGANEGGRQAANALLDAAGSNEPRVQLQNLSALPALNAAKQLDADRWRMGLPHLLAGFAP
jgi:uncharacterized protein with NAD-binding domain and iron-sulfur cluster